MSEDKYSLNTHAIRDGSVRTEEGEHSEPLFLTSSFVFKNAAAAAQSFSGNTGNIYSRFTNPTVATFERRLAMMEGGERCVATSSGMSAILSTCLGLLKSGDHIVSAREIFGTTTILFDHFLTKFGIKIDYVALTDYEAWQAALRPETKLLFLETPSNPLTKVVDIPRLADIAQGEDRYLVVDNCFCTPVLQRPLQLGADIIIHSATKYLDGQGRCLGGAVVGTEVLLEQIYTFLRSGGACLSPFNAWVFLKGLETLEIRMQAHSQNANKVASQLVLHPQVKEVYYPGLKTHPQHLLASRQQINFGGILSFELQGGQQAAWQVIDKVKLFSITANLGDTKSTITHPATTTHHRLSDTQQNEAGITPELIRLSIGLEAAEDLIADLLQALDSLVD